MQSGSHKATEYALIAGGSKGIGFAIAEAFAKRHYNLILIARHYDSLQEAKQFFEASYKISVFILPLDLSKEESAGEVKRYCLANNLPVSILCNVAGLGGAKDYLSIPLSEVLYMIRLNIQSAVALTEQMLGILEKHKPAFILNVASMAGFAPIPVKNIYSATKSAVIFFSRALRSQLKNPNISVSCLCPGPVFTKAEIEKDTIDKMGWFGKQMAVPPAKVGEVAVRKTIRGKFIIIPGLLPLIVSFLVRSLPDKLLVYIYEKLSEQSH